MPYIAIVRAEIYVWLHAKNSCVLIGRSQEVKAEIVIDYCVQFLLNAHKLWQEAQVDEQYRMQSLIFPEGLSYDAPTGRQTPKLSQVYAAIPQSEKGENDLAARQIVMKNPVINGMIDWYLVLRDIPAIAEMQEELRKPLAVAEANVTLV